MSASQFLKDWSFPDPRTAVDGLVAIGGDLGPRCLLQAYRQGIFPWFNPGDPVLWWSPDPRGVLLPEEVHLSRSLRRHFSRNPDLEFRFDTAFEAVVAACAAPRADAQGTWITPEMQRAYARLHALGHAHSIEVWQAGALVGGLYGVALGGVFFGESMFSRIPNGSKFALVMLARQLSAWGFVLIDTQFLTAHLASMGARELSRTLFLELLTSALQLPGRSGTWQMEMEGQDVF